jgi:hypothetical protein
MKEKDQFERIILQDWDTLTTIIERSKVNALSLYRLVSTAYTVAAHERADDQKLYSIIDRNCIFAHGQMCKLEDVIISSSIAKDNDVTRIIELLTGKYVPDLDIIAATHNLPFNLKEQKISDLSFKSDILIDLNQVKLLLDFCNRYDETIFKSYYIQQQETGYCLKCRNDQQYLAYTDIDDLCKFICKNCNDIILIQQELSDYKELSGILTDEELLLKVLEQVKDVKAHSRQLLPIYKDSISIVKAAYIEHLSSIDLDETSFIDDSDENLLTLLMASTIEKPEDTLYDSIRNKTHISIDDITYTLDSIKLQHAIEFGGHRYPLSKLLPSENKVSMLVDSLKERLIEKNLPPNFINHLFGEEIDKNKTEDIFSTLNQSNVILDNGVQLAFVLNYITDKKLKNGILCKVYDSSEILQDRFISNNWYLNGPIFIKDEHILNKRYLDLTKYLNIPYKNTQIACVIKSSIDNFVDIKTNLVDIELFKLLDYILDSYNNGQNISSEDIVNIKNKVGLEEKEYVISSKYCLPSEKLPKKIEQWLTTSEECKKKTFLKDAFGIHIDDSDAVAIRKYLSGCAELSISERSNVLSQMTCQWINEKSLILDDIQFSKIRDIIFDNDYVCELNKALLSEYTNSEHLHMVFGEYYLYWYKEEIPWNVKLSAYNYVFHSYKEKDIIIDGYNIYVNKNQEHNLYDLVRSIVNTNGFSTDDFLDFIDKYNAIISGSLDGEIDKDIDENARLAANQLAKQEAIEWLRSKGYNTVNVTTNFSFIDGICKDGVNYSIVVKSFRTTSKELKINPNEWLYLLKPNSRLMLYLGHMSFAVIDRNSLLGNYDFLKLRIASSNFSVNGNKIEWVLEQLAKDIQYFERTHFVFEHVHDNILTLANSLDDYGMYKCKLDQEYSAGKEEDIE